MPPKFALWVKKEGKTNDSYEGDGIKKPKKVTIEARAVLFLIHALILCMYFLVSVELEGAYAAYV